MTENPDEFLISTLQKIEQNQSEYYDYIKSQKIPEYKEIAEEYLQNASDLKNLLQKINSIDDLAECDEEEIGLVFELLEDYATNFVIHQKGSSDFESDIHTLDMLEEILGMFYDE